MNDNKILIIDDDIELCNLIEKCLQSNGMPTDTAYTGARGMSLFKDNAYCLVVLDVMLPDLSGFSLLEQIRYDSNIPILMLTAKNEEDDKVKGLKLGADDYLTKPFGIREFLARIESLIRRNTVFNAEIKKSGKLCFKGLTIDSESRFVYVEDQQISLSAKEFDLLYFLAVNKGRIFTKTQLYEHVWKDEYAFDDNNIMSYISKIRKKIELNSESPEYIQTVRGVGYRFNREV